MRGCFCQLSMAVPSKHIIPLSALKHANAGRHFMIMWRHGSAGLEPAEPDRNLLILKQNDIIIREMRDSRSGGLS